MENIIARFEEVLKQDNVVTMRSEIKEIRNDFRDKMRSFRKEAFEKFIADGGEKANFEEPKHPLAEKYQELLAQYKEKQAAYLKQKEEEANKKLVAHQELVKKLKELVRIGMTDMTKAFDQFNEIQEEWKKTTKDTWKQISRLKPAEAKQVQMDYSHQVDLFYHQVNMNREARELDYQRNLVNKQAIITKVKALLELTAIRDIEKAIRVYQQEWKKFGPVPKDHREQVNGEYKELLDKIYAKIQEFYDERREVHRQNLKEKIALCEQLNEVVTSVPEKHQGWQEQTTKVLALQKDWKKIGFSEENETIWEVFRNACDKFFEQKRNFYDTLDQNREKNKVKKEALCEKAEKLKHNDNWREITNQFIQLQKEWKTVGPATRSEENKLWKRFKEACDAFFAAKKAHFSNVDEAQAANLVLKEAFIKEVEAYELTGNTGQDFQNLKEFSNRWNAIGHVPFNDKDRVTKAYFKALDSKYDLLKVNKEERANLRYQNKLEDIASADNADQLLSRERRRLKNKIEQLQTDINQYENNLGFFGNSKKAQNNPLVKSVQAKIKKLKQEIVDFKKQLKTLPAKFEKIAAAKTAEAAAKEQAVVESDATVTETVAVEQTELENKEA